MPNIRLENRFVRVEDAFLEAPLEAVAPVRLRPWPNIDMVAAARMVAPEELLRVEDPVDNGPELWNKLLYAVNEIYEPELAIVAGGAVRDYIVGKPPKDIDIFVKLKDGDYQFDQLLEEAQSLGWKNVHIKGNPGRYGHNKNVKVVLTGRVFGRDAEIILVAQTTPEAIVETFDFDILKHWFDGKEVRSTISAKRDIAKKVWRVSKGLKLDPTLREHFNRVNKRHGGIYKLDEGEPWYNKFAEKAKIK